MQVLEKEEETKPAERLSFRQNPRTKKIAAAALILLAIVGFILWRYYTVRESTDDAQIDGHISPTSARVGGSVIQVYVKDNQVVEAGTVLLELDPVDYQVAVDRMQAEYDEALADAQAAQAGVPVASASTTGNLNVAQAGLSASQKEVDSAQARLVSAQAHLKEAESANTKAARDLERMKLLITKEEVSQQQYDAAVTAADATSANREAAVASVAEAEQQINVAQSHVQQARAMVNTASTAPQQMQATQAKASSAQAKVERAKAALEQAKLNLEYTKVKALIRGIVSKKSVEVGQFVQPGQPLMSIVSLDDVWVTANFKETQLKRMRAGQPVTIDVDAFGREYRGHVDSLSPATGAKFSLLPPENATGNYVKVVQRVPVKIVFEKDQDPEHLLRPGMSVTPIVLTK
jgi:membrane fusion protein, multidrug efflux system